MATAGGIELSLPCLVIVEGRSDVAVVYAIAKKLNLPNIYAHAFDGSATWSTKMRGVPLYSGFENVERIIVIRDADLNSEGAAQSIKAGFSAAGLAVPSVESQWADGYPATSYWVAGVGGVGEIEDVLLEALEEPGVLTCINEWIDCLTGIPVQIPQTKISKAKVRAYAAIRLPGLDPALGINRGVFDITIGRLAEPSKLLAAGANGLT